MPKIPYKNKAKKRLPSVTTILSNLGWNKNALVYWAFNQGKEGKESLYETEALTIGTVTHKVISELIKDEGFDFDRYFKDESTKLNDEIIEGVLQCLDSWEKWRKQSNVQIFASELSLVSEEHQFGGTLDCAGIGEKLCILDIKTGKPYADHLIQVAAYGMLYEENHPKKKIQEYHLVSIGKTNPSFQHVYFAAKSNAMQEAKDTFLDLLRIHRRKSTLEKAV